MSDIKTFLGNNPLKPKNNAVGGAYINIGSERFYKISNYDQMRPFFISLVSNTDYWLFISSTGGLSAGHSNENSALFPYSTDDKISDAAHTTGSKTIFRVGKNDKYFLWEPFSEKFEGIYAITRNLYKNIPGNKIIFEEINHDLNLCFQYSWQFSEQFGIIKKSTIQNTEDKNVDLEILDGILNILPYGVSADLQSGRSNLVNAYKKSELDEASGLGMFLLSSMIVDKPEPSEALKATTVWSSGLETKTILLSGLQVDKFRQGKTLATEHEVKAERGAYLLNGGLSLATNEYVTWYFVAQLNQDHGEIANLINKIKKTKNELTQVLIRDIDNGTQALRKLVGLADGLQLTGDELSVGRHFSNVLFNIMRGGVFEDQYRVDKNDLIAYVYSINKLLANSLSSFFDQLRENCEYHELIALARKTNNADLIRICYEYLPISFSRRHGDPSRPWNKFSIETKNQDGTKIRSYQGNWRDIFQNWEALAISYPGYILSMIAKFVNASTIDGYNPYRITRSGIDWEVIEPDDPWSFIGYWGDHQIIYLQKLMEIAVNFQSEAFAHLLSEKIFVYANVPYRIKSYNEIVKNPQDTIDFDSPKEQIIESRVAKIGADGKLVLGQKGDLTRANLAEKILVSLLAKLTNFIPEAGIWLNTQRPEWNDANNALVGNGVSMVTLYYMRRFVSFCLDVFSQKPDASFEFNQPVANLLFGMNTVFQNFESLLKNQISDENRKIVVDKLGQLGETYRKAAYTGFDEKTAIITSQEIRVFLHLTLRYIDHTIKANRRNDGLYHAYNLIKIEGQNASIDHLYEMLEGQVAVLSAGILNPEEALTVMDALKKSKIYRADQYSYMLYPDKVLPRFLDKNCIPDAFIHQSGLAQALIEAGNTSVLIKDENGVCHFNGSFNNANSLKTALDKLKGSSFEQLANDEYQDFLGAFEQMFNHKAFTGRSGTFFGYEGLGSIYWHMVSKLLLAVQENIFWGHEKYQDTETLGRLVEHYYEIRAGIGINKSPELYGSFPTDPYSHTPASKGAQQPGMTGQVKEDIINRWAELGLRVHHSRLAFEPIFLHNGELLTKPAVFEYFDVNACLKNIQVQAHELAFTYCQIPVIYAKSKVDSIAVYYANGKIEQIEGKSLNRKLSSEVFKRSGKIIQIRVNQNLPDSLMHVKREKLA